MTYEDKFLRLPVLRCPCCRSKVKRVRITYELHIFKCTSCIWKSDKVKPGISNQADLDRMELLKKNKKVR